MHTQLYIRCKTFISHKTLLKCHDDIRVAMLMFCAMVNMVWLLMDSLHEMFCEGNTLNWIMFIWLRAKKQIAVAFILQTSQEFVSFEILAFEFLQFFLWIICTKYELRAGHSSMKGIDSLLFLYFLYYIVSNTKFYMNISMYHTLINNYFVKCKKYLLFVKK